jgi:hypothetical protein
MAPLCSSMEVLPLRICVTGAAGHISYSLLDLIADGSMFGAQQPIILQLLDVESSMEVLKGNI